MYPKISIVVPIYNVEMYLDRCIKSILNQTFEDFEVILVNDGSTDNSKYICEQYRNIDSRIILIDKQNGGLSEARNKGIELAKGEFICFIDSDDWIEPDYCKVLYENICINNADVCQCSYNFVFDDRIERLNTFDQEEVIILNKSQGMKSVLESGPCGVHVVSWDKLYKKKLFENIRYPKGRLHEDMFTTYKIINECSKIVIVDKPLYNYVQRKNSIMNTVNVQKIIDSLDSLEDMLNFSKIYFEEYEFIVKNQLYNTIVYNIYESMKYNLNINVDLIKFLSNKIKLIKVKDLIKMKKNKNKIMHYIIMKTNLRIYIYLFKLNIRFKGDNNE